MDHDVAVETPHPADATAHEVLPDDRAESEPVMQGLRVLRHLVDGRDCVLFSIHPHGLVFHGASGSASARLARDLVAMADRGRAASS